MKKTNNEYGLTLVELLVVLVISIITSLFATGIIVNALNNNNKIVQDTQVRNEADYLMSYLIKEIYTLPESQITEVITDQLENNVACNPNQAIKRFGILYDHDNDKNTNQSNKSGDVFTGFQFQKCEMKLIVQGQEVPISNENITLNQDSSLMKKLEYETTNNFTGSKNLVEAQNNVYKVKLVFNYKNRNNTKKIVFENEISTIKDY
ncbi:prepilin-type N-terminal cleavage/methylation domain-containing protein [Lysinibacillus fusiformis]|nr:prepilin-type N-terminal cleavage/methylation domain-containing protein [Lysinibacillus fusiformis]